MQDNSQARKYQITLSNPVKYGFTREHILETLYSLMPQYFCLADEIAPSSLEHTHIFIFRQSPIKFSYLKQKFPIGHIEKCYGNIRENRDYVSKSGKFEDTEKIDTVIPGSFFEWGEIPTEQEEKNPIMVRLLDAVKEGMSTGDIIEQFPRFAFRIKDIDALRQKYLFEKYMKENREVTVHYIFGNTGTGKTRSIYQNHHYADVCRITTYKNNLPVFDNYMGQSTIVFEEFRGAVPIADMLNYLDVYPVMLPARYFDKVACYTEVYILSNISLYEQYTYVQANENVTWQAFLRRIDTVTEFLGDNTQKEYSKEAKFLW